MKIVISAGHNPGTDTSNPFYGKKHTPESIAKIKSNHADVRKEKHPRWKGGLPKCMDCNKELRDYVSKRCKPCSIIAQKGNGNPNWQGGKCDEKKCTQSTKQYKQWRISVFERDNYTCQECGDCKGGNLEAHHIKPFAYNKELRFDINNGQTLCKECHKKTDNWGVESI